MRRKRLRRIVREEIERAHLDAIGTLADFVAEELEERKAADEFERAQQLHDAIMRRRSGFLGCN